MGSKKYQIGLAFICMACMFFNGMSLMLISYSTPTPITECRVKKGSREFEECTEKEACQLLASGDGRVSFDNDNWTKQYGMYCNNMHKRDFSYSLVFFVSIIGFSFALYTMDKFGRSVAFRVTNLTTVVSCLGMLLVDNFWIKTVSLGFAMSANTSYCSICWVLLVEWLKPEELLLSKFLTLLYPFNSLGQLTLSLFALAYTDIYSILLFSGAICVVGCLPAFFIAQETPDYYMYTLDAEGMKRSVSKVSWINSVDPSSPPVLESFSKAEALIRQKQVNAVGSPHVGTVGILKRNKLSELLFYSGKFGVTMCLTVVFSWIFIIVNGLCTNLQDMGTDSLAANGIIGSVTQLIGSFAVTFIPGPLDNKKWLLRIQVALLFGCVAMLPVSLFLNQKSTLATALRITFAAVITGGSISSVYTPLYGVVPEIYPPSLIGTASTFLNISSNLISIAAPYFCSLATSQNLHFLVGISLPGFLAIPATVYIIRHLESNKRN